MIQKIWRGIGRFNRGGPRFVPRLAVLSLLAGAAGIAGAAPITVTNHSFENPATAGNPTGWTFTGNPQVWRPTVGTQVGSIPDGIQTAYILGAGVLRKDLGVATLPGTVYALDVWVGTQINYTGGSYLVELLDGASTVIASASGTRNQTDPFALISITGAATGIGTLRVQLTSTGGQPLFDNVQVQSRDPDPVGVPEPSTLALIGLGGLCLAWRKRT